MNPTSDHRERIRLLLRVEGAAVFVLGVYLWIGLGFGWPTFVGLFLLPDLFMVGYLAGPQWGARSYNVVHAYVGPALLAGYVAATGSSSELLLGGAYVWFAHIGLDRMIAAGLKYPTAFKHTHLSSASSFESNVMSS